MNNTKITIASIVAFTILTLPTSSFAELEKQKLDTIEIQAKEYNNISSFEKDSSTQKLSELHIF